MPMIRVAPHPADPAFWDKAKDHASRLGIPCSQLIRDAVEQHLALAKVAAAMALIDGRCEARPSFGTVSDHEFDPDRYGICQQCRRPGYLHVSTELDHEQMHDRLLAAANKAIAIHGDFKARFQPQSADGRR